MEKIKAAFAALRYGSQLADAAAWKNRQTAANLLVGLLGAILALLPLAGIRPGISGDDLATLASGIAVLGGVLNAYLTPATSKTVGLPPVRASTDGGQGRTDGTGNIPQAPADGEANTDANTIMG